MSKIWTCKIGEVDQAILPLGADAPMRAAVRSAYESVTGREAEFVFSGWGGELDEYERAVVEDRPPRAVNRDRAVEALLQAAKDITERPVGPFGRDDSTADERLQYTLIRLRAAIAQVEGKS